MRKKLLALGMAGVFALSSFTGCGSDNDKEKDTTAKVVEASKDGETGDVEESSQKETEEDKITLIHNDGEEIDTYTFTMLPLDFCGPTGGYTSVDGGKRFAIRENNSPQLIYVLSEDVFDRDKNKSLEEEMDVWMWNFGQGDAGDKLNITTLSSDKELSNAPKWKDLQIKEIVNINGRDCMRFGGQVEGTSVYTNTTEETYIYGYYFNLKYTPADGSEPYTKPMAILGGYKADKKVEITEQMKSNLQYNVDVMMQSVKVSGDSIFGEKVE